MVGSGDRESRSGRLRLAVSPNGREGSVSINADASIWAGLLDSGDSAELSVPNLRKAYVHVARGEMQVNGETLPYLATLQC